MNYNQLMEKRAKEVEERTRCVLAKFFQISKDNHMNNKYNDFISACIRRINNVEKIYNMACDGSLRKLSLQELQEWNDVMYQEFREDNYSVSFGNPTFAKEKYGLEIGQLLSFLYDQIETLTVSAYTFDRRKITYIEEVFIAIYESLTSGKDSVDEIKSILVKHYEQIGCSDILKDRIRSQVDPNMDFIYDIIMNTDLKDLRYLYWFGLYVSENELKIAKYLNSLSDTQIQSMADTYINGYCKGFENTGKDLSKKESANIIYPLGFEIMVRAAIKNLEKINIKAVLPLMYLESTEINRQFKFDHRADGAVYINNEYIENRLNAVKEGFEEVKKEANGYAGPAVIEKFGEKEFDPIIKKEALDYSSEQRQLNVEYSSKYGEISRQYIIEEERSFTIIAYPIPEIGEQFEEIFGETVKLNTLDYMLYQNMQQKIIDALDTADYVRVLGKGKNKTNIEVKLHELTDPSKQTNFENCVADVNIPVGEVFTSPVLKGTTGKLHVTKVYLNGLLFKNLEIDFVDGMIAKYSCSNFDTDEENKNYMDQNVMFFHKTLPLGEFAIGTNTMAYKMGIEYNIQAKLPILIAEKTGPHFAVGDTCFSHDEETKTYNPDGKEIIAKSNEVADLRHKEPRKAYFDCHTDITIPYDELEEITAISKDGKEVVIIKDGKFVLNGVEELNKPLIELEKALH